MILLSVINMIFLYCVSTLLYSWLWVLGPLGSWVLKGLGPTRVWGPQGAGSLFSGMPFRRTFAAPTFIKKEISPFIWPLVCVTVFEEEIVNSKAFEHANLIFTEPWVLTNEIMLNIVQNFKLDFLKNEI